VPRNSHSATGSLTFGRVSRPAQPKGPPTAFRRKAPVFHAAYVLLTPTARALFAPVMKAQRASAKRPQRIQRF